VVKALQFLKAQIRDDVSFRSSEEDGDAEAADASGEGSECDGEDS
jgi:hypothetical protein